MSTRPGSTEPLFDLPDDPGRLPEAAPPADASSPDDQLPLFPEPAAQDAAQDAETPWHQLPRAAFDLETTGKDAADCRIVTAALLLVRPDGTVSQRWDWLADPGVEIPEGAAAIHGITTEHARAHGRPADEVVAEIAAEIRGLLERGIPVLAFNASYDFTVLDAEARRRGIEAPQAFPILDPYVMHKHVRVRWRGKRTLVALAEHYRVDLTAAHTSDADALAAEQVARALAQEFPELHQSAQQLHEAQVRWSAEQAESFQQYLREKKQDPSIVIDGAWPVRTG